MTYGRELSGLPYNLKAKLTRCIIWGQRKLFAKIRPSAGINPLPIARSGAAVSERIAQLLKSPAPCFVGRFGGYELEATMRGFYTKDPSSILVKIGKMMIGESGPFWWDNSIIAGLCWNAGFFPPDTRELSRFSTLMIDAAQQVDLLGSYPWANGERLLHRLGILNAEICPLGSIDGFLSPHPWTTALRGQKVLVIHPFADTIKSQYAHRETLWKNPETLPAFNLKVIRAVSSLAGIKPAQFNTWFEALDSMKHEIAETDFDVALIGCGAYGFPLGAFVKRDLGKKAIHIGGATQILFGIRGKRWDANPRFINDVYNETWVRPFESDKPQGQLSTIEGGCYW